MFATVAVAGLTTVLQAFRFGRFGGGHVLLMGASAAFISVSITAVAEGGTALLATLVIITAAVPLMLSWRLAQVQRIVTPSVAGTVIMLIPLTVLPAVGDLLASVPAGSPAAGAPVSALVTVTVITALTLKAPGAWRLWAPVIGVGAGSLVGGWFGLYDASRVAAAAWIDLPHGRWPGFDLAFGPTFWALLPAFLLVAVIAAVRTMSSAVAVQRVSWRGSRAIDYRAVQGAVTLDGVGNLLSGIAGTLPNTTYSVSAPLISLTGVAARGVGVAAGAVFVVLVFLPKTLAVILAVPDPVFAGYLLVLLGLLFLVGINIVVQDGLDARKGTIVGLALLIGVSAHYGLIFPDLLAGFAGGLLRNGYERRRVLGDPDDAVRGAYRVATEPLPGGTFRSLRGAGRGDLHSRFLPRATVGTRRWRIGSTPLAKKRCSRCSGRMTPAGKGAAVTCSWPRTGRKGGAVLEFTVGPGGNNLQDRIALLGEHTDEAAPERDVSLRLLRHLASSVRHQQYHDTDLVTVRVRAPAAAPEARA